MFLKLCDTANWRHRRLGPNAVCFPIGELQQSDIANGMVNIQGAKPCSSRNMSGPRAPAPPLPLSMLQAWSRAETIPASAA